MKLTIRDIGHNNEEYIAYPIEVLPVVNNNNAVSLSVYFDTNDEYARVTSGALPASLIAKEYKGLLSIDLLVPKWYKVMIS